MRLDILTHFHHSFCSLTPDEQVALRRKERAVFGTLPDESTFDTPILEFPSIPEPSPIPPVAGPRRRGAR